MVRDAILTVANRPSIRRMVSGGLGRRVALRFVAGESLDDAIRVIESLNRQRATVSIDALGENVTDPSHAKAAAQLYLEALDLIAENGLSANVSVKLTQLGLDIDRDLAHAHAATIVARARSAGSSVTFDMEDHRYTDRTIEVCLALAEPDPPTVGLALQAYLHRTPDDLARLTRAGVHIRLCKGAYRENAAVAITKRADVDAAYARLAIALLRSGSYAMIATHDERLARHAERQARTLGRDPSTLEFQMLYGVRRELQQRLLDEGHRLRVYVPFGAEWYPYLMRRIAERPANVRFFAEALLRK